MKKLALHWKILIGMVLGVVFGSLMTNSVDFEVKVYVTDWIKPFRNHFYQFIKTNCSTLNS